MSPGVVQESLAPGTSTVTYCLLLAPWVVNARVCRSLLARANLSGMKGKNTHALRLNMCFQNELLVVGEVIREDEWRRDSRPPPPSYLYIALTGYDVAGDDMHTGHMMPEACLLPLGLVDCRLPVRFDYPKLVQYLAMVVAVGGAAVEAAADYSHCRVTQASCLYSRGVETWTSTWMTLDRLCGFVESAGRQERWPQLADHSLPLPDM